MRDRRPATRTRQAAAALVATVSLLALVVYGDGPAAAHASLVGATPADGSTVRSAPARITLRFDENIRTPAVVIVAGPDGKRVDHGATTVVDNTASVPVRVAAPGVYTVSYRVISGDGHPVAARTTFAYRGRGAAGAAAGPGSVSGGAPTRWLIIGVAAALVAACGLLLTGRTRRSGTRR